MEEKIIYIDYKTAIDFLLPRHYSGRKPQVTWAFGWYIDGKLKAVATFGKPASRTLCTGIMKGKYSENVYELNRLCRLQNFNLPLSHFISKCLKELSLVENLIIVSYADREMKHTGYVYQAANFIYTGATKPRTDIFIEGSKHHRHAVKKEKEKFRKVRSSKHRYVYFCTKDKKLKKEWLNMLAYPIQSYPKEVNKNYKLGDFLKPRILKVGE